MDLKDVSTEELLQIYQELDNFLKKIDKEIADAKNLGEIK